MRRALVSLLTVGLAALTTWRTPLAAQPATRDAAAVGRTVVAAPAARTHHHRKAKIKHVFVINIENEGADSTYGASSPATYLSRTLRSKGLYLPNYYGIGHHSLPNYIAQISGQAPNPTTQQDCPIYSGFAPAGSTGSYQQAVGSGCVYDDSVNTLPLQLTVANLSWKGYMDGMATPCQHPTLDLPDPYQQASPTQEYATRHDPFMYFHSIIDQPTYCAAHVVPLTQLATDLRHGYSTPNLSYITPDLCDDGHDAPCADGRPGGLTSADAWMREWVPRILHSKAFKKDGLLVITADEAENEDATACCGEIAGPNAPMPGVTGPGGGRVGALVLSPLVKRGSTSSTAYNHYSLLASIEAIFHLDPIGFASTAPTFGKDVYNKRPHRRHHHG